MIFFFFDGSNMLLGAFIIGVDGAKKNTESGFKKRIQNSDEALKVTMIA